MTWLSSVWSSINCPNFLESVKDIPIFANNGEAEISKSCPLPPRKAIQHNRRRIFTNKLRFKTTP